MKKGLMLSLLRILLCLCCAWFTVVVARNVYYAYCDQRSVMRLVLGLLAVLGWVAITLSPLLRVGWYLKFENWICRKGKE